VSKKPLRVVSLIEHDAKSETLGLRCVAGRGGLENVIDSKNINRPGLALGGYFDFFAYNRIQVFGLGEAMFLKKAQYQDEFRNVQELMTHNLPCCIFSNNYMPPEFFLSLAESRNIPVLISKLSSADLVDRLYNYLTDVFAPTQVVHGVLIEMYGVGVLIKGQSGIGKSETALELVERGHRLVADDTIELKAPHKHILLGKSSWIIKHHMEIRGLGIINIKHLFGVGAVRNEKDVQLVIELEDWQSSKEYDRIGDEEQYVELLGVQVPYLLIPVKPGRNIPIIIETAAKNQRLKLTGLNAARDFNQRLINYLESESIRRNYYEV
jgi:HPr kinase/phosphorylase